MAGKPEIRPTINVTPLVDVVLVLLIIFMVVTPMMASGVAMDLPKAKNPEPEPKGMDPVTVSVAADGTWLWNRRPVSRDELAANLRELGRDDPGRSVLLLADRNIPFREIRPVFAICRDADLKGVALKVSTVAEGE